MSATKEQIEQLQQMIDESNKIVFFGGAGVSTESGVPDFRSVDGLYHQQWKYPPETMLSHSFYMSKTKDFYEYYFAKLLVEAISPDCPEDKAILPNAAHKKLAELEKAHKLIGVVTQNIDGLHQKAGSEKVYELHGSIHRNYCTNCRKFFDGAYMIKAHEESEDGVPRCDECGGDIKPDVVLYEEGLDNDTLMGAIRAISAADMMIIGGTSLAVYPAAGLIDYFHGKHLVVINKSETSRSTGAELTINGSIGEVLGQIEVR